MSETEDDKRRRHYLEVQAELNPGESEVERTLSNILTIKAGWHRVRNEAGGWAYFPSVPRFPSGSPEQRQLEDDWEQRALAMHAAQEPVTLAPKPLENTMTRIRRGD